MALAARWKGVASSRRRASAHGHSGLPLQQLAQLADGPKRALQSPEASGRQCSQTGKKGEMGTPDLGGSSLEAVGGHTPALLCASCEVMAGKLACLNLHLLFSKARLRIGSIS